MTTVIIENIDRLAYSDLPPIIYTDSQGTYHKNTSVVTKVLSALFLWSKDNIDHAWQKIYTVSGGWITGAGCGGIIRGFARKMEIELWSKPYWDYTSSVFYVTKLGEVYYAGYGSQDDGVTKQGWIWIRMEGEGRDGEFFTAGSGGTLALDAYRNRYMTTEGAIKYAAKLDPYTNDVIQCNIDFRKEIGR